LLYADIARIGENINACRILTGQNEGKRQLGRPGSRWEVNMKMEHKYIEYEGMN
jgi:hypothetical protein